MLLIKPLISKIHCQNNVEKLISLKKCAKFAPDEN
jgi:hypothetical protein